VKKLQSRPDFPVKMIEITCFQGTNAIPTWISGQRFCILRPSPEKVLLVDRYPRKRGGLFCLRRGQNE
jgi:hypothetical protein